MKESQSYVSFIKTNRKLFGIGLLISLLLIIGLYCCLSDKYSVALLYEVVPEQGSLSDDPEKYSILTDQLVSLLRQEQLRTQLLAPGVAVTIYKDLPIGLKLEFTGFETQMISDSIRRTEDYAMQKAITQYQLKVEKQGEPVSHQSKSYLIPYLALLFVGINLCTLFIALLRSYFKKF